MNHRNSFRFLIIPMISFLLIFISCVPNSSKEIVTGFYFNTFVQLTFYGNDATSYGDSCLQICDYYEKLLSRTVEGSDIWNLNHAEGEPVTVSDETVFLLETAIYYSELTDGKVDPSVALLMDLWNFTSGNTTTPPSQEQIDALLPLTNYKYIVIVDNTVQLMQPGMAVDLGFIAKGYVADKLKEYLVQNGVTSAIIDLGGNVLTVGVNPSGNPYSIGIRKPFSDSQTPITTLSVSDQSVVTSGIYERYFTYDDTIYHHILLPQTGYPVQNELAGVTIISDSSVIGDALSTTCLLLGQEDAEALIRSIPSVEAVFVTKDNEVITLNQKD